MIESGWLQHHDTLIMDNTAIHTGKVANIIEDLLWNTIINDKVFTCVFKYNEYHKK